MPSPQSLSEADRRQVAAWAADCAERVLVLFETEAPADGRPRDAIARTRAFARGELDTAGEIRRRFVAGRAARAGSAEDGYEIASIDPTAPTQEIEVPGAWTMPAMLTLTVRNYVAPDFPAFGSAALS